jgi:hypothetical protein
MSYIQTTKNKLGNFGYHDVLHRTVLSRHRALGKAIREYGALSVFRKLNAVWILNRNVRPKVAKIFKQDRDWVRMKYMI